MKRLFKPLSIFTLLCICLIVLAACSGSHTHTPSEAVRENEVQATCETDGNYDEVVYCLECNEEISRITNVINAIGHDEINHEAKAPTCTEIGWDAYVTCSRCNYSSYSEKEALAHSLKNKVAESSGELLCSNGGTYVFVTYCELCNFEFSRETINNESGVHKVIDGECVWCGGKESTPGLSFSLNLTGKGYIVTGIGTCTEKDIVIGLYNNLPVTKIAENAFCNCTILESITIS